MDFKIKYPQTEDGPQETLSWGEIAGTKEFSALPPNKKAAMRQWFMGRAMSSEGLGEKDVTPEHIKAFSDHMQAVENPELAKAGEFAESLPGKIGQLGSFQALTKAGETFLEMDRPLLERVAPGAAKAIAGAAKAGGEFAESKVRPAVAWAAGDPAGALAGKAAGFITEAAGRLPVDLTQPTNLATLGTEAVGRSLATRAGMEMLSEGAGKRALAEAMIGESGVGAAEAALAKKLASPSAPSMWAQLSAGGKGMAEDARRGAEMLKEEYSPEAGTMTRALQAKAPEAPMVDAPLQHGAPVQAVEDLVTMPRRVSPQEMGVAKRAKAFRAEAPATPAEPPVPQRGALPGGSPEPGAQPIRTDVGHPVGVEAKPNGGTAGPVGEIQKRPAQPEVAAGVGSDPAVAPGSGGETLFEAQKPVRVGPNGKPEIVRRATPYESLTGASKAEAKRAGEFEARNMASAQEVADAAAARERSVKRAGEDELRLQKAQPGSSVDPSMQAANVHQVRANVAKAVSGEVPPRVNPPEKGSLLHRVTKYFIDPVKDLWVLKHHKTYAKSRAAVSSGVHELEMDTAPAVKALNDNLKTAADKSLFDTIFNLRSMREAYKLDGLDYGGLGSKADELLLDIRQQMAGQEERLARIDAAVEQFADATSTIGIERARNVFGAEYAENAAKKYRYYRSFEQGDLDASQMLYGEQAAGTKMLPSLEDYARGFLKERTGGGPVLSDPLEAFQKSHWRKIMAGKKKEIIDTAVEESASLYGKDALAAEIKKVGGRGWVEYALPNGDKVPMPEAVVKFISTSDPHVTSLFSELSKDIFQIARRGYLDLNVRYYPGMVLRDVADTLLRSRGYLSPQTEWLSKKIGGAAEKVGLSKFQDKAYDLEYLSNPAIWARALKSSWSANFSKGSADRIFRQLEKMGAIQTSSVNHIMELNRLKTLYPETMGEKAAIPAKFVWENLGRIMKAWDDTLRIGQSLRSLPKEYRGMKNWSKVMNLQDFKRGSETAEDLVLRVRNTNIDFNMMGEGMRQLRILNPFINPAIQDKYQTLQYAKEMPVSFAMTSAAMLSAAAYSYMQWKAKPEGGKLSPADTQRYILVDTGMRTQEGNPLAIPAVMIPDSLQPAWAAIRNMLDVAHEKSPEFRQVLKDNYAKKTAGNVMGATANISGPLVATAETLMNYSFFLGRPIEEGYNENLSPELRAKKQVPNLYRLAGRGLGVSPDRIQYLSRGLLGAPGQAAAETGFIDEWAGKHVKLPREEGGGKAKSLPEWLSQKMKGLPKTVGLIREGKFDAKYAMLKEMLGPSLTRDADASHIIRQLGTRYGQEKDPEIKRRYQDAALETYREYIRTLPPGEKAVDFSKLFGRAIADAQKAAATGETRTSESWRRKFPAPFREVGMRFPKNEEGQDQ